MKRNIWIPVTALLAGVALIAALLFELVCGFSLTRGLSPSPVQEIYLIVNPEEPTYLSIDTAQPDAPFTSLRVHPEEITFAVDPGSPAEVTLSSHDPYIWGNRWPWVEKVTLTLKTAKQKAGFEKLFTAERLNEVRQWGQQPQTYGITKYGKLTSEGRILEQ